LLNRYTVPTLADKRLSKTLEHVTTTSETQKDADRFLDEGLSATL
jgi:hypothetical protein